MTPMRILGVDPGTIRMGIGVIEQRGQSLKLLFSDTINAPQRLSVVDRLDILLRQLSSILDQWKPHCAALETNFLGKNPQSAFQIGLARGIVIAECLRRELKIGEYTPSAVKAAVTGYGRAEKSQVKKMTELLLGAKVEASFDASDALAVAICHGASFRPGLEC